MESHFPNFAEYPWLQAGSPGDLHPAAFDAYVHATEPATLVLWWFATLHFNRSRWCWVLTWRGRRAWHIRSEKKPAPLAWANEQLAKVRA